MLTLFSPAKLNLFFRVLRKREDDFHEIASLFQAIDLGDSLTISPKEGSDQLVCSNSSIPTDSSNLVLRAACLFREKTGSSQAFFFDLKKKVPVEAGLGGGSGNAATTLWGLNAMLNTKIDVMTLAKWGSELGSDIPFFFSQGTAFCEGRGEMLTAVPPLETRPLWLAKPKYGLSTPKVYQTTQAQLLKKRDPIKTLHECLEGRFCFYNDLEIAAFQLMPSLKQLKEDLVDLGFNHVNMTGSGTCFFCLGDVVDPQMPGIEFFPVDFLQRDISRWYKFPA